MSDKGKGLPFGFKSLMTFMVYGLLLLLFFMIMLHWHRYIASDFVILRPNMLGDTDAFQANPQKITAEKQRDEAAASSRKVLHGFVERQLSSGRLPIKWNDKRVWQPWASDPPGSPCFNYTTRAMISKFKLDKGKSHVKQVPEQTFNTTEFHGFVKKNLINWHDGAVRTLVINEAPLHVVYYERLVQNPLEELTKVLAFLGVPRDEGRMACIASHLEGNFKRKDSKEIDPYTLEEKVSIVRAANAVNRTLQVMGYPPLPSYN